MLTIESWFGRIMCEEAEFDEDHLVPSTFNLGPFVPALRVASYYEVEMPRTLGTGSRPESRQLAQSPSVYPTHYHTPVYLGR